MSNYTCGNVPERDGPPKNAPSLPSVCPKCGGECAGGYGLTGGGMGVYVFCQNDTCDFFAKIQDRE